MKATIDRFEGGLAVLVSEDGTAFNMPVSLLPEGCGEGDVLDISIERNPEETARTRKRVSDLMERLKKRSEGKGIVRGPEE